MSQRANELTNSLAQLTQELNKELAVLSHAPETILQSTLVEEYNQLGDNLIKINAKLDSLNIQNRVVILQTAISNEIAINNSTDRYPGIGFPCPFSSLTSGKIVCCARLFQAFLKGEEADIDEFFEFSCYPFYASATEQEKNFARRLLVKYAGQVLGQQEPLLIKKEDGTHSYFTMCERNNEFFPMLMGRKN